MRYLPNVAVARYHAVDVDPDDEDDYEDEELNTENSSGNKKATARVQVSQGCHLLGRLFSSNYVCFGFLTLHFLYSTNIVRTAEYVYLFAGVAGCYPRLNGIFSSAEYSI